MEDCGESQRMPLRCTECARRRVRCDKKAPCSQCIQKDRAHLCAREVVRVRGKLAVAVPLEKENGDLIRENSKLRDRLSELEVALMLSLQDQVGIQSTQGSTKQQRLPSFERVKSLERIGAILDDWNLGVVNRKPAGSTFSRYFDRSFDIFHLLPNCATSTYIVKFTLENLGWIHCAVSADQFMKEHDMFQNCLATGDLTVLENHGWMAIYFSLLTVGLFFMSHEEVSALSVNSLQDLSNVQETCGKWYNCAFRHLELANSMATPHLETVQVAAILTLCNSHFGETFRDRNMTSIAITTARALNMHRLGTESSYPKDWIESTPEWSTREGRNLGRRLWWTLTICDWLNTLWRQSPLVHPSSFDSNIYNEYLDNDIILYGSPLSDGDMLFSPILHHIAMSKVARQVYDYTQSPKKSSALLSQFLRQLKVLEHDFLSQIDRLISSFVTGVNKSHPVPLWVYGQKAHYCCTLNFIRLTLSRILLQPSLPQVSILSQIRTQANEAAINVVEMDEVPELYRVMWIFGTATIAAGVFLCLELLISDGEYDPEHRLERRQAAKRCIDALYPYGIKTKICREGPRAIQWLLDLEDARKNGRVSSEDILNTILSTTRTTERNAPSLSIGEESLSPDSLSRIMEQGSESSHMREDPGWADVSSNTFLGYDQSEFEWLLNSIMYPTAS